jgi:hypothetical protein
MGQSFVGIPDFNDIGIVGLGLGSWRGCQTVDPAAEQQPSDDSGPAIYPHMRLFRWTHPRVKIFMIEIKPAVAGLDSAECHNLERDRQHGCPPPGGRDCQGKGLRNLASRLIAWMPVLAQSMNVQVSKMNIGRILGVQSDCCPITIGR